MKLRKDDAAVRAEHEAVRNHVGYYDFTHKLLEVTGPDSEEFLDKIYVGGIGKAKNGEAKYTTMLNDDGEIIDDVIVFKIDDDRYWISTLYIDELIDWLNKHRGTEDVDYNEITDITTMYAVQGPDSRAVLDAFLGEPVDDLAYFTISENTIDDVPVRVARSGYTGELGYEIYVHPDNAALVEEKLEEAGSDYDIKKLETDVIVTSLPREKGYVLMSDLEGTNPLEVGFGWTVDWNKDFIGKEALEKVKENGAKRKLLGFTVEDDTAVIEPGAEVLVEGEPAGKVTMFTYGYTVGENIGFALVDTDKVKIGDEVLIDGIPATITERVFYDPENERIRA